MLRKILSSARIVGTASLGGKNKKKVLLNLLRCFKSKGVIKFDVNSSFS